MPFVFDLNGVIMSKVAILDTKIDNDVLACNSFTFYNVLDLDYDEKVPIQYSHGSICAQILDELTSEYDLINIQVLENVSAGNGKPRGYINDLKKGLQLCDALEADIICLSAVSSVLSDSKEIYDIVRKISKNRIVLAAIDNNRYITIPASYPFVIGVQSDRENRLKPGEVAYCYDDLLCTDVYANCDFDILRKIGCTPSNSFAVPVVDAKVNDWINGKKNVTDMLKQGKQYDCISNNTEKELRCLKIQNPSIPIVVIHSKDSKFVYNMCREVMDKLFSEYDIEASCLSSLADEYDVRARKITSLSNDLLCMQRHYKTDIILISLNTSELKRYRNMLNADVYISLNRSAYSFVARYDCGALNDTMEMMPDAIYKILTEQ